MIEGRRSVLRVLCRPCSFFVKVSLWIVEILYAVKEGDVELGARTSKQIYYFCDCFLSCLYSISITCTCVFTYLYHLYLCFYFHCNYYLSLASFMLVDFSLSIKKAIEHLNSYLEEYRGELLEPLFGNPASLLNLSWPLTLFILIIVLLHLISIILIQPSLGVLSIGIWVLDSSFWFNHLREIL